MNRCLGMVMAAVLSAGVARAAGPNLLVALDAAEFDAGSWTNKGSLGGTFLPVGSGAGISVGVVDGVTAVSLAGGVDSVMTNMASPSVLCGAAPWSVEMWFYDTDPRDERNVMFTWTAREKWPDDNAARSCVEFRYGWDAGNAVEHYEDNVGWGGSVPVLGRWHHLACTRDAGGVERIYLDGALRTVKTVALRTRDDIGFFTIGAVQELNYGTWIFPFGGSIARLRVYDGPLSFEEVLTNLQADVLAFGAPLSVTRHWKGAPGSWGAWDAGANWVGGVVPLAGDSVVIDNGGKAGDFSGVMAFQNFFGGDGGFSMTGGVVDVAESVVMGDGAGREFDFRLEGGTFRVNGTDTHHLFLGSNSGGSANVVVGGGSEPAWLCVDKDLQLASGHGSRGYMEVGTNGLVTVSNGWFYITCSGVATGEVVVSGGTIRSERNCIFILGQGHGAKSTLTLNDGLIDFQSEMRVSGDWSLSENSEADAFLNGGVLHVPRVLSYTGQNRFYFNGGTIRNRDSRGDFLQGLTAAYVQAGGAVFDVVANTDITVAQPLLDAGGGLTKRGAGTLRLTGANTFAGGITVEEGLLIFNGAGTLPNSAPGSILLQGGGIGYDAANGANALLALLNPSSVGTLMLFGVNAQEDLDLSGYPGVSLGMSGDMEYQGTLNLPAQGGDYKFLILGGGNHYRKVIAGNVNVILEEGSTGHLGLSASNTYTGDTLINGGSVYIYDVNALGNPANKQNVRDIGIYNGAMLVIEVANMPDVVSRIKTDSRGTILLNGYNDSQDFDFSVLPGMTLGTADGNGRNYTGVMTPHASVGYHFGGGALNWWQAGVRLQGLTDNPLGGSRKLVAEYPGTVALFGVNSFSGGIVVTNRATLWIQEDPSLGAVPAAAVADYLTISGGGVRFVPETTPMLTHTNRGITVGDGGATFYPPGNRYAVWQGDLSGSGSITGTDNGVIIFGGANNTWSGKLTLANNNNEGTFAVGYGDQFSWPKTNVIQGNGMFGVATDLDITWSAKFENPLGSVPPQYDAPDGTSAPVGLRKMGAGTLTLDTANTYRRDTRVDSGILKVGAEGAIPWGQGPGGAKGNLHLFCDNVYPAGMLDLNGFDVNVNGLWGAGSVTNSQANVRTLTFGHDNREGTFHGAMSDSVKAVKVGDNPQRFWKGAALGDLTVERGTVYAGAESSYRDVGLRAAGGFVAGLSASDAYGLTGAYYNFDYPGIQGQVQTGILPDLIVFEDFLARHAPNQVLSSSSMGEGFHAGGGGEFFQAGYHERSWFFCRWTGEFYAAEEGVYGFATASDDGSVVYINRDPVALNDFTQGYDDQGGGKRGGTVQLTQGWHDIIIGYFQGEGGRGLTVFMTPPAGTETILPQALLRPYPATVASLSGDAGSRVEVQGNAALEIRGESLSVYGGRLVATATDARIIKNGAADLILSGQRVPEFGGQLIVNEGNLGLRSSSPTTRPLRIKDGGTLFAYAEPGGGANKGMTGSYYWGWYGGASFENLQNDFDWRQLVSTFNTMQDGIDAQWTAMNFWYADGVNMPGVFSRSASLHGEDRPNFCAHYKGRFIAPESGDYTFGLASDNQGDLYLNGERIIENTNWDTGEKTATRHLNAGSHDLQVAYGYWGGGCNVRVSVTPPGGEWMRLPNAWLRQGVSTVYGLEGDVNLDLSDPGAYLCLMTDDPMTFPGSVTGIPGSELEKNGADTLTLTGDNDAFGGGWLLLNGTLVVGDGGVNGTLGGESIYVGADGLLVFNRSDDVVFSGQILGKGEIRSIGSGRVILTGSTAGFDGTFTTGNFVFSGEGVLAQPDIFEQGPGLPPLTVHFEDGAQLILPPPTGTPLTLPSLVFSNGTISLPFTNNASYYIDALTVNAGTTLKFDMSEVSGLFGRYYIPAEGGISNEAIMPTFTNLVTAETFLSGLDPFCVASTWDADDALNFGSSDNQSTHPLTFPQSVITRHENFAAIWKGYIRITTSGLHTFETWSDDNSMLYINGDLVVDNNGPHGMVTRSGQVTLDVGLHEIAILFAQGGGGYGLTVSIASPGQPLQYLPNSMLVTKLTDIGDLIESGGVAVGNIAVTLEVGTLGVVNGPGEGTIDLTGETLPLDGTLLLNNLFIETPGATLAVEGNAAVSGSNLHVIMGNAPPKGTLTKIGDFTRATYGLPLTGKTTTLEGVSQGKVTYKPDACLYVSTSTGTLMILR